MHKKTNWYWKQQPLQQKSIVPTRTILHPRLEVIVIRYVQNIPKKLCGILRRHPIIMTGADYDYVLDEIERCEI